MSTAILFQAIFASSSLSGDGAFLPPDKESGGRKAKKIVGKLFTKLCIFSKDSDAPLMDNVVFKKSKSESLIELLPKEPVKLTIDYFNDDTHPFIVSTHNWLLKDMSMVAVDSARVHVVIDSEEIKGLSHFWQCRKDNTV